MVGSEAWALVPADQQHEEEMVRVQALCLYASGVCFLHLGRGSSTPFFKSPPESHCDTSLKHIMDCTESLVLTDVRFGTLPK